MSAVHRIGPSADAHDAFVGCIQALTRDPRVISLVDCEIEDGEVEIAYQVIDREGRAWVFQGTWDCQLEAVLHAQWERELL